VVKLALTNNEIIKAIAIYAPALLFETPKRSSATPSLTTRPFKHAFRRQRCHIPFRLLQAEIAARRQKQTICA